MTDDAKEVEDKATDDGRRGFLSRLTLGLSGIIAGVVAIPSVGFVLGPVLVALVWTVLVICV